MGSGDYGEAEEALSEGNIMDPKNAQIWGCLCVVCMKRCKGRPDKLREAEESLKHALTLGIGIQETFPVEIFIIEQVHAPNFQKEKSARVMIFKPKFQRRLEVYAPNSPRENRTPSF
jgi:hypothetical protein